MLAYFKDTSAKILRVQVSNYTDAIPKATPHASLSIARSCRAGGGSLGQRKAQRQSTKATTKMHEAA